MKSIFILIISAIFFITTLAAQSNDGVAKGVRLISEGQYRSAINYLTEQPQSIESEFQLGKVFLLIEKSDSAEIHFRKAASLDPSSPYALLSLGLIELQKKNNDLSAILLKKATKKAKKSAEILAEIAKSCVVGVEKDYNQAIETIEFGKGLFSQSTPLAIALGDVEFSRNEYGKALSGYEWAVSYDKTNAEAYRKMGVIQSMARDYKNGVASLNISLEINPDQILAYKNLSDLQFLYGKFEAALSLYKTYMSKTVPTIDDKERYSLILFFNKKYDESAKEMDIVMKENPNSAVLYRIRGYISYETGDYAKGVDLMKKFFEIQKPEKILQSDYTYAGRLYAKVKNYSEAIVYLKKAVIADSTQNEVIEELAGIYSKIHQHQNAVSCYTKMVANGTSRANGLFMIGKEYFYLGSYLKTVSDSLSAKGFTSSPQKDQAVLAFKAADSVLVELNVLSPKFVGGYLWRGRALSYLDPESANGLAKEPYEKAAAIIEAGDVSKSAKSLIECYEYLASYNYMCYTRDFKSNPSSAKDCKSNAIAYFEKIYQLDPSDNEVKKLIVDLKK